MVEIQVAVRAVVLAGVVWSWVETESRDLILTRERTGIRGGGGGQRERSRLEPFPIVGKCGWHQVPDATTFGATAVARC